MVHAIKRRKQPHFAERMSLVQGAVCEVDEETAEREIGDGELRLVPGLCLRQRRSCYRPGKFCNLKSELLKSTTHLLNAALRKRIPISAQARSMGFRETSSES
jgi:hypothetical protein